MSKWMLKQCSANMSEIAANLKINNTVAQLLYVRDYKTEEQIRAFLCSEETVLPDYMLFRGMQEALSCISAAIDNKTRITVYGDYDADGIMSTVILYKVLKALGADVGYYIPDRESEGYGLNNEAVNLLKEQGTELIFACDNGISAMEQLKYAHELDMQTVVIDHHDVQFSGNDVSQYILPEADALINPKIPDCRYPFKQYCAGGLCYRLAEAIYKYRGADWGAVDEEYLVLAAIATVCDLVDLKDDNRYIVKKSLPLFTKPRNLGLHYLLEACGLLDKEIQTFHIGYIIGPCINASGRLLNADTAVNLFMEEDESKARELAEQLVELNAERKNITGEGADLALMHMEENPELKNDKILVLYEKGVQSSVAGIIAGKIKERYHKPVIMLTGEKDIVKGSCRSVEQYNIFEGLSSVRDLLENFGGHPMAAGLSIKEENISEFRRRLNEGCQLTEQEMEPVIHIDKALNIYNADLQIAEALEVLEPFGKGNEAPYFADKHVIVKRISVLGKNANIIRLACYKQNCNKVVEVISFYLKDSLFEAIENRYGIEKLNALLKGQTAIELDIIYTLGINEFNGRRSAQLTMVDFRIGEK